jgi:hypothetical protein
MLMLLWLVVCSSSFNIFLSKELNAIFIQHLFIKRVECYLHGGKLVALFVFRLN